MHAVIFDIDGTLLDSDGVDGELYIAAVQRVLGPVRIRENWAAYRHVTDSGILAEILQDNRISGDAGVIAAIETTLVESLKLHLAKHGAFAEIPGARAFLGAGFPVQGVPISSADDSHERCAIMENALHQLGDRFQTVTYYGDGAWDREAASSLGWACVAVGAELGGIARFEANAR